MKVISHANTNELHMESNAHEIHNTCFDTKLLFYKNGRNIWFASTSKQHMTTYR
jgi:hypothetical protein